MKKYRINDVIKDHDRMVKFMNNQEKYETYKSIHGNLKKAINSGFYYEAIFLEYAILEDRLASVLKYADIPYSQKDGRDVSISTKLNRIENRTELSDKFYKDRFTTELLNRARAWLDERNDLIHHLAKLPYSNDRVKNVAIEGRELVDLIKNRSASVIRRLKARNNMSSHN